MSPLGIPGIDAESVATVPIDGKLVTGSQSMEVRAPYDGSLLGSEMTEERLVILNG